MLSIYMKKDSYLGKIKPRLKDFYVDYIIGKNFYEGRIDRIKTIRNKVKFEKQHPVLKNSLLENISSSVEVNKNYYRKIYKE